MIKSRDRMTVFFLKKRQREREKVEHRQTTSINGRHNQFRINRSPYTQKCTSERNGGKKLRYCSCKVSTHEKKDD